MKNCTLCSEELRFENTPLFGSRKLKDGGEICSICFKRINNANPNIAVRLNRHSLSDIKNLFQELDLNDSRLVEIKEQIQNLKLDNISTFFGRKEINELPQILATSEIIDNVIQGGYNNGQGILVSTNRRLLFVDKGLLYGLKVEDFPLEKITSIQYETGIVFGKVTIHTSGNIAKIENVDKVAARKFAEFVRNKLSQPKESQQQHLQPDILSQIEKLGKLREAGILSEEEFLEQKKKLLEKL